MKQDADPRSGWRSGPCCCQRHHFILLKPLLEASWEGEGGGCSCPEGWQILSGKDRVAVGSITAASTFSQALMFSYETSLEIVLLTQLCHKKNGRMFRFSFAASCFYQKHVNLVEEEFHSYSYLPEISPGSAKLIRNCMQSTLYTVFKGNKKLITNIRLSLVQLHQGNNP